MWSAKWHIFCPSVNISTIPNISILPMCRLTEIMKEHGPFVSRSCWSDHPRGYLVVLTATIYPGIYTGWGSLARGTSSALRVYFISKCFHHEKNTPVLISWGWIYHCNECYTYVCMIWIYSMSHKTWSQLCCSVFCFGHVIISLRINVIILSTSLKTPWVPMK